MTFVVLLIAIALVLSSRTVQRALPFESFVAVGAVAIGALALFQLGKLG